MNNSNDNKIDKPHDKRFKELLSNKKRFLSLLKDCVKQPWVDKIDESMLRKSENSFILQDFSEKEADVVYEAVLDGNKIVFYVLLEHQSRVDYQMPYRLLLYITEILRHYYNNTEPKEREIKEFKFPVVFPIVLFTGSEKWTVPLELKDIFENSEQFGDYVLNFKYLLLDAKGYKDEELKNFSSKLLAIIFLLEKSKTDIEFYSNIRDNLNYIKDFDDEEKRVLNMCIKIMDLAYGYNKSKDIKILIEESQIEEVESMLCDVIENAKYEKEQLFSKGVLEGEIKGKIEGKIEVAKTLLTEGIPIELIIRYTGLSREEIDNIRFACDSE